MAGTRGEDAAGSCVLPAGSGTAPALRGLSRFADARGIPASREFLLDYDVIEAFCVAAWPAGHRRPGARTGRRCPARRSQARAAGAAGGAVPGCEGAAPYSRVSGRSWQPSPPRSATRRNAPRRWLWRCSASARGCGPASWWRCAAATSPGTAAGWPFMPNRHCGLPAERRYPRPTPRRRAGRR